MQGNDIMEDIWDIKSLRNKLMTIWVSTILLALFANDIKDINFLFIKFKDGHELFGSKTIACIVIANVFYLWRYYQKFRLLNLWNNRLMAIELLRAKKAWQIKFKYWDFYANDDSGSMEIGNCNLYAWSIFTCNMDLDDEKFTWDFLDENLSISVERSVIAKGRGESTNQNNYVKVGGHIELTVSENSKNSKQNVYISLIFEDDGKTFEWMKLKSIFTDSKYMDYFVPLSIPLVAIGMLLFNKLFLI